MTVFYDPTFLDGYKVVVRPYELSRRWVRYHRSYLPYMDEQKTTLRLTIKPPDGLNSAETIEYSWTVSRHEGKSGEFGSGGNIIQIKPCTTYKSTIETSLILSEGKYIVAFVLSKRNGEQRLSTGPETVGVLSMKDRADMTTSFIIPMLLSAVALTLSIVAIFKG